MFFLKLKCFVNNFITFYFHSRVRTVALIIFIPLCYGTLTIIKTLYLPDCYGFEASDELAHTFVDIPLAKKILSEGEFPLINLFNNFGSPVIGEPVSYPFAIHAISYYIFPPYVASTLNRFIIATLSILVLILYYKEYFSIYLSAFLAILAISLLSFFHFLVHHPHQGAVFYFVLILLIQRRLLKELTKMNIFLLYISILIFFLSVGIKGAHYAIPFIILNQFFISDMKFNRHFFILLMCMVSSYIFVYPHFASFYRWATLSTRAYIDYPEVLVFSVTEFIRSFFFFDPPPVPSHIGGSLYFSLPIAILIIEGIIKLPKLIKHKKSFGIEILILGLLPFLIVNLTEVSRDFRALLTLGNKPFDLASFLWFSNIYLMLLVGYALNNIKREGMSGLAITMNIVLVLLLGAPFITKTYIHNYIYLSVILVLFALVIYMFAWYSRSFSVSLNKLVYSLVIISLIMAFIPPVLAKTGLNKLKDCTGDGIFFAESWKAKFHPKQFIDVIEPYSRMVSQIPPVPNAYDQWAGKYNIFGSNGRSITINWEFTKYLQEEDMIKIIRLDQTFVPVYYITSQDTEKLSLLGIEYVITNKESSQLIHNGWKFLAYDPVENLYLYKNPRNISPVYLTRNSITYIKKTNIKYKGNSIYIDLPEISNESDLVATFIAIPGWKAQIDGVPANIHKEKDSFLRVKVKHDDRLVIFKFEPYTLKAMLFFILISIILMVLTIFLKDISKSKT